MNDRLFGSTGFARTAARPLVTTVAAVYDRRALVAPLERYEAELCGATPVPAFARRRGAWAGDAQLVRGCGALSRAPRVDRSLGTYGASAPGPAFAMV